MNETASSPIGRDRLIRVDGHGHRINVSPADGTGFERFPLPAFPLSYRVYLTGLVETMYARTQRAMAVGLLLDCQRHRWGPPMVPRQQCCADGVSWSFSRGDFRGIDPQLRLAGTIQSGSKLKFDEERARIPTLDGIHLYVGLHPHEPSQQWFVTCDGVPSHTIPEALIEDDWQVLLAAASTKFGNLET